MSVSCSIDIKLVKYVTQPGKDFAQYEYNISAIMILKKLLNFGWTLNCDGLMCYLPIGDKDDFNWTTSAFNFEQLTEIIERKKALKEVVGVNMWWKNTGIGAHFLFWVQEESRLDGQFSLSLDANRPTLFALSDWHKVTDVSWYLIRLLPAFNDGDMGVEFFRYEEHK